MKPKLTRIIQRDAEHRQQKRDDDGDQFEAGDVLRPVIMNDSVVHIRVVLFAVQLALSVRCAAEVGHVYFVRWSAYVLEGVGARGAWPRRWSVDLRHRCCMRNRKERKGKGKSWMMGYLGNAVTALYAKDG